MRKIFYIILLCFLYDNSWARQLSLGLPIECNVGHDCWVIFYPDNDSSSGISDYACQYQTYDTHNGTDFGLPDLTWVNKNIHVLAAATGKVVRVRDGMIDVKYEKGKLDSIVDGRECGNYVLLEHDMGYKTLYCHMRKNSFMVMEGDMVEKGEPLGYVGLSGKTTFSHVHFTVKDHANKDVDPFTGKLISQQSGCHDTSNHMWDNDVLPLLQYQQGVISGVGFAAEQVNIAGIRYGRYDKPIISSGMEEFYIWADLWKMPKGAKVHLLLKNPQDTVIIDKTYTIHDDTIHTFRMAKADAKTQGTTWPWLLGYYHLKVTSYINGKEYFSMNNKYLMEY